MKFFDSCMDASEFCSSTQTYSIAHLLNSERVMDIHIHDYCEVYYSISGGTKFLIGDCIYTFKPGDIFFINCNEAHHLSQVENKNHERYVVNVHPQYLVQNSSVQTDLSFCFNGKTRPTGHLLSLTPKEQQRFLFLIHKLSSLCAEDFGSDIKENSIFLDLLIFFNELFSLHRDSAEQPNILEKHYERTNEIIIYINQNLSNTLSLNILSKQFSLSPSHLNRIFKEETGTTLQKYISSRRIALAKTLLTDGCTVAEAFSQSGFGDYSNFYKTFTKTVGLSPKNYAINSTK